MPDRTLGTAPVYTEEQLQAAWKAFRHYRWPTTYAATMQDPVRAQLVRIHAAHMAQQAKCAATKPRANSTPQLRPHTPYIHPACIDRKRAAAGDLDD